jgi:hypothetical protein
MMASSLMRSADKQVAKSDSRSSSPKKQQQKCDMNWRVVEKHGAVKA